MTVERMLPLYEAKMLGAFDHRSADVVKSDTALKRQNQPRYLSDAEHRDPSREALPLHWVREELIPAGLPAWLGGFSDVTSSTNERTLISSLLPTAGVGHTYPLILANDVHLLVAQMNSFVVDFLARQKVAGLHLTYTYLRQIPFLRPDSFERPSPWKPELSLREWVTELAGELTCTSYAMSSFARANNLPREVYPWESELRTLRRAELDACFFHLFGIERPDVEYIMDTFPIVQRKDEARFGTYRTKELILEVYDAMQEAIDTGVPYEGLHLDEV